MLAPAGSFVEEGEVVATVTDPESPLESHDVISPTRGLMICSATNPFVTAGTPVDISCQLPKVLRQSERG